MGFNPGNAKATGFGEGADISRFDPIPSDRVTDGPNPLPANGSQAATDAGYAPASVEDGNQLINVLATVAQRVNMAVPELLDFITKGVNIPLEKFADIGIPVEVVNMVRGVMPGSQEEGFLDPGPLRTGAESAGDAISFAMGATPVARAPSAISLGADVAGLGSTSAVAAGRAIAPEGMQALDAPIEPQLRDLPGGETIMGRGDEAADAAAAAAANVENTAGAGKKFDPATGRVKDDPLQEAVIDQGFSPPFVALTKGANQATKSKLVEMVDVVKDTKANLRKSVTSRPSDVAGESVLNRVKVVRSANKQAGEQLDTVANDLKGKSVDSAPLVNNFVDTLDGMGITFNPRTGKANFNGSEIEGLPGPKRAIQRLLTRMWDPATGAKQPDAHELHKLKRYIDETVTYGKNAEGLAGKTEVVMKGLRRNIDMLLDSNFPEYDRVNTTYSETINALDALQDVAGRKMDFGGGNADSAIGTLLRRLLSNAQSRVPLEDALNQLDDVAQKYNTPGGARIVPYRKGAQAETLNIDDDIISQVKFIDELEKIFGTPATTSLQGETQKAITGALEHLQSGRDATGMALGYIDKFRNRGKTEKNALAALYRLLDPKYLETK